MRTCHLVLNCCGFNLRRCENWYHLDCVKIDEDRVHLVDQFICPICANSEFQPSGFHTHLQVLTMNS